MILVVRSDQVDRAWIVNHEAEGLKAEVSLSNDRRLRHISEGVVFIGQTFNVTLCFVYIEQVTHHNQSVLKLDTIPDVLLFRLQVVHFHFDIILFLSHIKAAQVEIEALFARATACSEAKAKRDGLVKLFGDLVCFVDHWLDLASQLLNLHLASLLTLHFTLFLQETLLLLLDLALMLVFLLLHGHPGQVELMLAQFQLVLTLDENPCI